MKIDVCSKKEQDYIIERLVEYNLSQVEAKQKENFIDLSKKIGKDDKIVAGIVARMYCWNVVYVDTLWVDSSYRGKKLGSLLLEEVENDAKSKGAKLIFSTHYTEILDSLSRRDNIFDLIRSAKDARWKPA